MSFLPLTVLNRAMNFFFVLNVTNVPILFTNFGMLHETPVAFQRPSFLDTRLDSTCDLQEVEKTKSMTLTPTQRLLMTYTLSKLHNLFSRAKNYSIVNNETIETCQCNAALDNAKFDGILRYFTFLLLRGLYLT